MHEPRPHGVVVVGDVTSTMACTLAAVKLGLPVAHIEAGLRSGDRSMPEEINRIVTDALADLLFVSDPDGLWHLAHEGRPREQTWLVGNIMMDTLYNELKAAEQSTILQTLRLQAGAYAFMTLHRPSNVDTPQHLQQIVSTIQELSYDLPVVFAVHPRTRERISSLKSTTLGTEKFRLIEPLGYRENLCMMKNARMVISDSGGIQEETTVLNVPCLTLRENTERPITVELGSSELVGNDPAKIREAWYRALNGKWKITSSIPLWDGRTAERIVSQLGKQWL
jgi:UDP-N-acetylglucosamine 2-epimerase (non-hydrolysing)